MIVNMETIQQAESIADIITLGTTYRQTHKIKDDQKRLLLAIDIQNDFMEGVGSLGVAGSLADVARLNQWLYNNVAKISHIICSVDTHHIQQIFHPAWWINREGKNPEPFTTITEDDVQQGIWCTVNGDDEHALEYLQALAKQGYRALCIWPYHCLEGAFGHQLEASFIKMLYFHAAFNGTRAEFITKGQNPKSEMYGIIKPEHDVNNDINLELLNTFANYDEIYIAGEASSHCVLASVMQIVDHFKANRAMTSRLILLEDCMSPIAGFEASTADAVKKLTEEFGVKVQKSTVLID